MHLFYRALGLRIRCTATSTLSKSATGRHGRRPYATNSPAGQSIVPEFPDSPTNFHHDLASFVAFAERTGLDTKSTYYVGTHYEYRVSRSLSRYGLVSKRVGGPRDHGTDVVGLWTLPKSPASPPIRVLVQCKSVVRRATPANVREMAGTFDGAPVGWKGPGVLGILASLTPATEGVREAVEKSRQPLVFVCCSRDGLVSQMLWNGHAEKLGLEGYGVAVRYVASPAGDCKTRESVLTLNGRKLPLLREQEP